MLRALSEAVRSWSQPEEMTSDHGPHLVRIKFSNCCKDRNIEHKTSSLLHPAENGQVEQGKDIVKSMMKRCAVEGSDWLIRLTSLRNTPGAEGIPSLATLSQGRTLRDR